MILKDYLPEYLMETLEFKEIFRVLQMEFDELNKYIENAVLNLNIKTATEEQIEKLEQFYGVMPNGLSLEKRKEYLLSLLRISDSDLNFKRIEGFSYTLTGGGIIATLDSNNLKIYLKKMRSGYAIPNMEKLVLPLLPAHLNCKVEQLYYTWGDIKNNNRDFASLKAIGSWDDVKNSQPIVQ